MHNTEDIYDVSASLSAVCRYLRGGQFKRLQVCLIECTNTCFPVFWLRKKEREKEKRYPPPVSLLVFAWMTMDNYDETRFWTWKSVLVLEGINGNGMDDGNQTTDLESTDAIVQVGWNFKSSFFSPSLLSWPR